jgi:predicted GNAT family acetyltransferase
LAVEAFMAQSEASSNSDPSVVDNIALGRFELAVEGGVAFADYRREPGHLVITHVETPPALRGGGIAGRLMAGLLDQARGEGVKVAPICPYAAVYIRRHRQYQDLVD